MLNFIIKPIDNFLNKTAMYRLVLYYLSALFCLSLLFSFLHILPYSPVALLLSAAIIIAVSYIVNSVFSKVFGAQTNVESLYITALILVLIITPPNPNDYLSFLPIGAWGALFAMVSKYIVAIGKKHIFNPVAFSMVLLSFTINQSPTWWVGGNLWLSPFVILGGILVVRKIKRTDLVLSFIVFSLVSVAAITLIKGGDVFSTIIKALLHSPIFFFAFVMITEPLTTPPRRLARIIYGAIVGILFAPMIHLGQVYSTPELALIIGNIFSYIVSPKIKLALRLKEVKKIANDTYDYVFESDRKFDFEPGQYLEWTLGHSHPDDRGNRRYFTIASSPTESDVRIGVKFYPEASSFKKTMLALTVNSAIFASQLAGEFVMPKDKNIKLAFIAGGIGVTPFRSMIKYLIDKGEKRDIVLFYSNKNVNEIAYSEIFDQAEKTFGLKKVFTLTDNVAPDSWTGERGFLDKKMIERYAPDYLYRTFYVSGPHGMVTAFFDTLRKMGVPSKNIKTDFFPGFV